MLIDKCVDFCLVVVLYLYFGATEEAQPYLTDMPHELALWAIMVLYLSRVVTVLLTD